MTDGGESTPASGAARSTETSIRETYDEYEYAGRTIGTISDPENSSAWLKSDETVTVRP